MSERPRAGYPGSQRSGGRAPRRAAPRAGHHERSARSGRRPAGDASGEAAGRRGQDPRGASHLARVLRTRDGRHVATHVAARVHRRPRRQPGRLARVPRRAALGADRPRRRRRVARVPERLPAIAGASSAAVPGRDLAEIRCPFHRWTWGLDGRLREVPSRREFGVLNDDYPLIGVQVDTWGPMVFVNLDPRGGPARRVPRPGSGRDGLGEPRGVPRAGAALGEGRLQLEDAHRRLQRDVPRAGHPPRDVGDGRRRQRAPGHLAASRSVGAVVRTALAAAGSRRPPTTTCSRPSSR